LECEREPPRRVEVLGLGIHQQATAGERGHDHRAVVGRPVELPDLEGGLGLGVVERAGEPVAHRIDRAFAVEEGLLRRRVVPGDIALVHIALGGQVCQLGRGRLPIGAAELHLAGSAVGHPPGILRVDVGAGYPGEEHAEVVVHASGDERRDAPGLQLLRRDQKLRIGFRLSRDARGGELLLVVVDDRDRLGIGGQLVDLAVDRSIVGKLEVLQLIRGERVELAGLGEAGG
jgi:hypothetical protein